MAKRRGISRVIGDVGLGALGLAAGAALFLLFQSSIGGAASDATAEPSLVFDAPSAGPGAASPQDAVRWFLDAEVAGNSQLAFGLLSGADRRSYASAQLWASRSPLGAIESWSWIDDDALAATAALEPGLSLTQGWSPASTTFTFGVVDEDGWRVSLETSRSQPDLPAPEAALEAAASWLADPARCGRPGAPGLVLATTSSTFERVCVSGGVPAASTSSPVDGRVAAELELAYGPGVATWARSVALEGGVELTLAAIGDRWLVIDAATP